LVHGEIKPVSFWGLRFDLHLRRGGIGGRDRQTKVAARVVTSEARAWLHTNTPTHRKSPVRFLMRRLAVERERRNTFNE
jgi:hypothetical protein